MGSDRFEASDTELSRRKILSEYVGSNLSNREQETGITFFGDSDRFQITTYKPSLVKRLLRHAYADIEWLYVYRDDEPNKRVEALEDVASDNRVPEIEGVRALLPIGALSIKGVPRKTDKPSGIVNTPESAKEAREAFSDD